MVQQIPLPLTVSCFSKIQIGLTFLVPAHLGSPGERAVKWVCVCEVRNFKFGRAYIHWPIISKRSVVAWPILNFWGLNHISGTTEVTKSARFCTHAGHVKLLALEWQDTPVPHVVIVRVVWCILEFYIPWNISGMAKTKDFKFCTRVGHVKSSHFVRRLIVMSSSICVIKFRNIVVYSWSHDLLKSRQISVTISKTVQYRDIVIIED